MTYGLTLNSTVYIEAPADYLEVRSCQTKQDGVDCYCYGTTSNICTTVSETLAQALEHPWMVTDCVYICVLVRACVVWMHACMHACGWDDGIEWDGQ